MGVVAEVVEALEAMAGLPAVAFSRLHVEQHLVPGVQVHVDAGGVAYQAAGQHLQLLVDVGLVHQGVKNIQHRVHIPNLAEANQHVERLEDQTFHHFPCFPSEHYLYITFGFLFSVSISSSVFFASLLRNWLNACIKCSQILYFDF